MKSPTYQDYRHNLTYNLLDGGFFGFAMGFASFMTIFPLFVSHLTDSALLIGLIPAIHAVGWQLPQLFTAHRVSRLKRYKPMVMSLTLHERLPFVGMIFIAWFLPSLGPQKALVLTFMLLIWQGLGAGFTATPWQSMIAKIIPGENRGTFLGFQSAAANLLASGSAVLAGIILDKLDSPLDFTLCYLLASIFLAVSMICLGKTREVEMEPASAQAGNTSFVQNLKDILKRDKNFRWFLVVRMFSQPAIMAFAFFTVYAVRRHGMNPWVAGVMTGVFTMGQIATNPLLGWIGDRWSHTAVLKMGSLAASLSALIAWLAPNLTWFYLVFILAGVANVAVWTIGMAMTMEFGSEADRPAYIGLSNTLVAPVTILAPIFGGWLADHSGYPSTFLVSVVSGIITTLLLHFMLRDPRKLPKGESSDELIEDPAVGV